MKRVRKGSAGYILYERIRRILIAAVLLIIPVSAYFIALAYFGTNKNAISIIAILGCVPAAGAIVSLIMFFSVRPVPMDLYEKILPHTGDLVMAYELYLTNYDKNTLLDAVAVCGQDVVGLATYKPPKRKDSEQHIENVLRADGFSVHAVVFDDPEKFLMRLDTMNAHARAHKGSIPRREDPRFPEETREEQILHVLKNVSL